MVDSHDQAQGLAAAFESQFGALGFGPGNVLDAQARVQRGIVGLGFDAARFAQAEQGPADFALVGRPAGVLLDFPAITAAHQRHQQAVTRAAHLDTFQCLDAGCKTRQCLTGAGGRFTSALAKGPGGQRRQPQGHNRQQHQ